MHISPEIGSHNPLMPIDTLAISKRLHASGMPKKQAEAQAEVLGEIITQNLASKADIEGLRYSIKTDIEDLKYSTKIAIENIHKDIENLRKDTTTAIENSRKDLLIEIGKIKFDIMKWIVPLMVGQLAAATGLFKMLGN